VRIHVRRGVCIGSYGPRVVCVLYMALGGFVYSLLYAHSAYSMRTLHTLCTLCILYAHSAYSMRTLHTLCTPLS